MESHFEILFFVLGNASFRFWNGLTLVHLVSRGDLTRQVTAESKRRFCDTLQSI
jgi:hypothetical protein